MWPLANLRKITGELSANFDGNIFSATFFGLVFPGFQLNGAFFQQKKLGFRSFRTTFSGKTRQIGTMAWKPCTFSQQKRLQAGHCVRTKVHQTFFIENVARNGLKSHIFGPKSAPFCCKNANLSNHTCFTRIPPPPKKSSRPKFVPRIVGIPLQFHFLEPKLF